MTEQRGVEEPAQGGSEREQLLPAGGEAEPESTHEERRDERTRTRLREVEAERDALAERVATYQRRERDRIALGTGLPSQALTMLADEVPMTDEGDVDEDAVAEAAKELLATLRAASPHHHADLGPKQTPAAKKSATWEQVIGQRRR